MATAYAECKCATCGAEFTKIMYGTNRRDADSKAEWAAGYFDECDDCSKARKLREMEAATQEAEAAGLPKLNGSEKQAAWAVTIRQKIYEKLEEEIRVKSGKIAKSEAAGKKVIRAKRTLENLSNLLAFLTDHTAAHWWIDNRDHLSPLLSSGEIADRFRDDMDAWIAQSNAAPMETEEEAEIRKAAEEEMVAAPQGQTHSGVVEITVTDKDVTAQYPKDEDFRAIVKRLGYAWDADRRVWNHEISVITGAAQERAAELGNNLLNAGFAIQIADPDTRQKAIEGDYQPEHRRWILIYTSGDVRNWFCVLLPERGDGMYEKAKAIKGSRYCKPDVAIPAKQWREVLDFAEMNDYRISPAAQELIDAQKAAIITVTPAPARAAKYHEIDPGDIMNNCVAEIPADLLDD